ncbi:response regulator transcription factor [Flavobacterium sp. 5]|uniref:response regulator transcription factor n=1 Tax=Flavobacterium sp. 5 TaxID=2035199 RepID=UPI000C2B842A|nr:response regulator transcription factor [Flavobacterium sp. 5]PKB18741.1 LuxR family two component transcriptional regulator [Flavobacterium sp. 5]
MSKKILIVDDHLVVRTGVSIILEESFESIELFTTENFPDTISLLKENEIELIILDINIPGGKNKEMIREIRELQADVKILIFSVYEETTHAYQYIMAGANGYLNKLSDKEKIVLTVDTILKTGNYFAPDIVNTIINASIKGQTLNPLDKLSKREMEICELLIKGNGNIEISNKLDICMTTVSTHKNKIFGKLNIKNIVELITIFNQPNG